MTLTRLFRGHSAHVVAFLALMIALGGSAYAIKKNSVTSKAIVNETIKGKDVKDDRLSGDDIDESTLGEVPDARSAVNATNATNADRAASADSATQATDAGTVGGQQVIKINYRAAPGSTTATLLETEGLRIFANCAAGSAIAVIATTTKTGSSIYAAVHRDSTPADPLVADLENGGFGPGIQFDLLAGGTGNINIGTFGYDAPDGTVATGTLTADENAAGCVASGNVIIG